MRGRRQFQAQILQPEFERYRLLRQQPGMLVFTAADPTAQHQEKIDDIGICTGVAYVQFDVIDFQLAQLDLQFGQIRGLVRQKLFVGQPLQLLLFGVQVQILVDAFHNRGLKAGHLVNSFRKSLSWLIVGVRKTDCRGRLTRSGMVAGSLPQLAKGLTIQELQNCKRRTSISPAKKTDLPFQSSS